MFRLSTGKTMNLGEKQTTAWKDMILKMLLRLWALGFILAFLLYLFFEPNAECSKLLYMNLFVVRPTVAHGIVLLFATIAFRVFEKRQNNMLIMSIITMISLSLFAGVIVCVHTSVAFMPAILLLPIAMSPLYRNSILMIAQMVLSVVIYIMNVLYFIPNSVYMPPGSWLVDIAIFAGTALALIFISEQIHTSIMMQDEQAKRDSLTHLYNHEFFYEELERSMEQYHKKGTEFSILVADIDRFKQVNDTYGHAFGDTVICKVAEVMQLCANRKQFVARYGGEEFTMILPGYNLEGARVLAEIVREEFKKCEFVTEDGTVCHFSLSIGVAEFDGVDQRASQFFDYADKALYEAKRAGRDRVCCYEIQSEE